MTLQSADTPPMLAIVIVSWNVCDLLRHCLRAVEYSLADATFDYTIVVVDNASSDQTPAMVRAEFPHVCLIEAGRNGGFAAGNNLGLRALGFDERGGHEQLAAQAKYVLLLNPDTEPLGAALPLLVRYLDTRPDVVVVGPQLRYADGTVQSSRRRFSTRATFFAESTVIERWWPRNRWVRRYHCVDQSDSSVQAVGWLVGAALLVRGVAIQQAGLLDERFFMYSEEQEWQQRLSATANTAHAAIVYLPQALVTHYEGKSSEQVLTGRHINFQRSKLLLARMRYGWSFAAALRWFLLATYLWELVIETTKLALHHRPALRRERIAIYATVLRDGLARTQ